MALRDRHLYGAGAAACAVCCAAPILSILGIAGAGAAATAATFVFAGTMFALVVGGAALAGVLVRRRTHSAATREACNAAPLSPVSIDLSPRTPTTDPHRS